VSVVEPLGVLLEDPAAAELPSPLAGLYGGGLALADDLLYANFISSLDGVTSLPAPGGPGRVLRGTCDADRFVMGLLRALADAVVVGAGTLRAEGGHLWTAGHIDRERAAVYRALGWAETRVVVVTASGELDPGERALEAGALVLTTGAGAARLRGRLPAACTVRSLDAAVTGPLPPAAILAAVRAEGHRRVLTEGGPTLLAGFAAGGLLDEMFLTLSPVLAGRRPGDGRLGLVDGAHLLPGAARWARLRSVRTCGDHLFLRYAFMSS
jgi:riboflavin biosynthesis pyrimidine reductase